MYQHMQKSVFINWKDITRILATRNASVGASLANKINAGDMLSKQAATDKQKSRQYLLKVLSLL